MTIFIVQESAASYQTSTVEDFREAKASLLTEKRQYTRDAILYAAGTFVGLLVAVLPSIAAVPSDSRFEKMAAFGAGVCSMLSVSMIGKRKDCHLKAREYDILEYFKSNDESNIVFPETKRLAKQILFDK